MQNPCINILFVPASLAVHPRQHSRTDTLKGVPIVMKPRQEAGGNRAFSACNGMLGGR